MCVKEGNVLVAVYGTLMRGERNAHWRDGVPTRGEGRMRGKLYDTGYGYPAFVPGDGGDVRCELLEADADQVAHMDVLEGYPSLYDRKTVTVRTEDGSVKAIVYVMNRLPGRAVLIAGGDWPEYRAALKREAS